MEAIIFVGLPASGKSTFYKERFFDTHVRINLDMLRTRHREHLLLHTCIEMKQKFVVDNTNPTPAYRAGYIVQAKAAGFAVVGDHFDVECQRVYCAQQYACGGSADTCHWHLREREEIAGAVPL